MYEKLTKEDIRDKYSNDIYEFSVDETKFIRNKRGLLFRKMKSGYWKMVKILKIIQRDIMLLLLIRNNIHALN